MQERRARRADEDERAMLSWFEVENFKSIKRLRLDTRSFMVLVGANGAGKTNIVQALALFLDILRTGSTTPIELYGGYEQLIRRGKRPARRMRFALRMPYRQWDFEHGGEKGGGTLQVSLTLRPRADGEGMVVAEEEVRMDPDDVDGDAPKPFVARWGERGLERVELSNAEDLKEELRYLSFDSEEHIARRIGRLDPETLRFAPLYAIQGYSPAVPLVRRFRLEASSLRADWDMADLFGRRMQGLTGKGLPLSIERMRPRSKAPTKAFKRVLSGLQEVYPGIEDVKTIHFQPGRVALSFKERGIDGELGEANVSDGVMHALALLVALEEERKHPGILAIEEPENALHPWALRKILQLVQERAKAGGLLLLTTHSPVVVDSVPDPAALFVVENAPSRGTTVTPALEREHALEAILAESGQKLGDVWLGGTLGGVPRTGT